MLKRVNAIFYAAILGTQSKNTSHSILNTLLCDAASLKLPKRKKKRPTEPRKVLQKGERRFMTKSRELERAEIIKNSQYLEN